jgi:hypothetical protein
MHHAPVPIMLADPVARGLAFWLREKGRNEHGKSSLIVEAMGRSARQPEERFHHQTLRVMPETEVQCSTL